MRFAAILSMYGSKDLSTCSSWTAPHDMVDGLNAAGIPTVCEWVVPKRGGVMTWPDKFFAKRWHHLIYALPDPPGSTSRHTFSTMQPIPDETVRAISPRRGHVILDFVFNGKFIFGGTVDLYMYVEPGPHVQAIDVPVVTWMNCWTVDQRNRWLTSRGAEALMISSLLATRRTFCLNTHDRDSVLALAREYLSPTIAEAMTEKVIALQAPGDFFGVDARFEKYEQERQAKAARGLPMTVFYAGSITDPRRRLPLLAESIDAANAAGAKVNGRFMSQYPQVKENPFGDHVWLSMQDSHDEYLDALGQGDIAFLGTTHQGTTICFKEQIRSGQIPLIVQVPEPGLVDADGATYSSAFVPESYPFICKRKHDLTPMLCHMVTNFAQIKAEWQAKTMWHIDRYSPQSIGAEFSRHIDTMMQPVRERNLQVARNVRPAFTLLEQAVREEQWPVVTDPDVVHQAMAKRSRTGFEFKDVTPLALRWMLMNLGYRDRDDQPGLSMERT